MQSVSVSSGSAAEGGGSEEIQDHKEGGGRGLARREYSNAILLKRSILFLTQ